MNNAQHDIELIRKYYQGLLSPAEKNLLEARALDDPFLQDAMDGFEQKGVNLVDLQSLNERLENRLKKSKRLGAVWGIKQWGIAASVLIGIAVASIYLKQMPKNETIALNEVQQKEDIPQEEKARIQTESNDSVDINPATRQPELLAEIRKKPISQNKPNAFVPEEDVIVEPLGTGVVATEPDQPQLMASNIAPGTTAIKKEVSSTEGMASPGLLMAKRAFRNSTDFSVNVLKGKVVDETNHAPLPGVSITNLVTGSTTQSDVNGNFSIPAQNNTDLEIKFLGYNTNKLKKLSQDSVVVALTPSQNALAETVVVGYGTQTREDIAAKPSVGWKRFKNYLDLQAAESNLGRGKVELQFLISPNGELSDFKILNTFSARAGVAAINFIKNYNGGWTGSSDGLAHKATISIRFK